MSGEAGDRADEDLERVRDKSKAGEAAEAGETIVAGNATGATKVVEARDTAAAGKAAGDAPATETNAGRIADARTQLADDAEAQTAAGRDVANVGEKQAGDENLSPEMAAAPAIPVGAGGTWEQVAALGRYMTRTEVHTYAFSVAAQAILSLFPFIVLLLTLSHRVFHSTKMVQVVSEMMTNFLPSNQEFVMRNMRVLAFAHTKTKIVSVVMLLITTTGVFLPLEVALNSVWGVKKNRSYLANQLVSLALAASVSVLAMASVALSSDQHAVMNFLFFGHTHNLLFTWIGHGFLRICALLASIGLFFLIYWGLPNRKIPPGAVLPTAIVTGLLWEGAKYLYIMALPQLDFRAVYGPFEVSVGLIVWAFLSGLLLLAGAYVSATRQALREAREADRVRNETAA